jgi:acetolactate synthase-1/2/3 large subunit
MFQKLSQLEGALKELLTELKTPRYGPVLMDLPVNLQMSSIEKTLDINLITHSRRVTPQYDISEHLYKSKRPVVVFGHGVKLAGAEKEAMKFIEKTGIPFLVSWGAFDLCASDHPLRVGSPGVYGDRVSNYVIQNADLIVICGKSALIAVKLVEVDLCFLDTRKRLWWILISRKSIRCLKKMLKLISV